MTDSSDASRPPAAGSSPGAAAGAMSFVLKAVVIVLAVIGGIAVLDAIGMATMHFGMMGGMGGC